MTSTLARVRRQHTGVILCFGHNNYCPDLKPWVDYEVSLMQTENGGMENEFDLLCQSQ